MRDIVAILRGELNNCQCAAYSRSDCGCMTEWPEDACEEAADEIELLRARNAELLRVLELAESTFDTYVKTGAFTAGQPSGWLLQQIRVAINRKGTRKTY